MISRQEFTQFLWESLKENEYVWLNPSVRLEKEKVFPEILIASKSVQNLLTQMRQHPDIGACRASFRFQNTFAVFSIGQQDYQINFTHKMVSKNLYFLSEEEVYKKSLKNENGISIPCIEHILEYSILKSFLNRKGVEEEEYRFFKDFHILVQEDLIEYFNERYQTNFRAMFSITEYNVQTKQAMVNCLKEMQFNRLTRVMNIHWHNFLGSVRKEARMI